MATIAENISQAINDFGNIKTAIINKGVDVPNDTPTANYPEYIQNIETGGSGGFVINGSVETLKAADNIAVGDFVSISGTETEYESVNSTINTGQSFHAVMLNNTRMFVIQSFSTTIQVCASVYDFVSDSWLLINTIILSSTSQTGIYLYAVKLSENKVVVAYTTTTNSRLCGRVCSIETDGTITAGAQTNISTDNLSAAYMPCMVALSESTAVIFSATASANRQLCAYVLTINGISMTVGTIMYIDSVKYSGEYKAAIALSESKILVVYCLTKSSNNLLARIFSVEGSVLTLGQLYTIDESVMLYNVATVGYSKKCMVLELLNATTVVLVGALNTYSTNSNNVGAVVLTLEEGVIISDAYTLLDRNGYSPLAMSAIKTANGFFSIYRTNTVGSNKTRYIECKIKQDKSIQVEDRGLLGAEDIGAYYDLNIFRADDKLIIAHSTTTSSNYFSILMRDDVSIIKKLSGTIKGIAKTAAGVGEPIKVYVP